jgi:hypothetical protein
VLGRNPMALAVLDQTMKWPTGTRIRILALLLGLAAGACSGAAFRLSFLEQESTLADTCQLLRQAGMSQDSVSEFSRLVVHHNLKGNRVDRSRFPAAKGGFYEFRDLADFTNRLRTVLHWTPSDHSLAQYTFTCFDAACLLLRGAGCGAPEFEKDLGSKGILLNSKGIVLTDSDSQAFRSDYDWALFPASSYERLTGKPRSEGETQLMLSIRATRFLPGPGATNELAWRAAFASYIRGLKEGGLVFPKAFKLGLGFYATPKLWRFFADHALVCIPAQGRLVCVEKNGSPGPYVRAEFECEEDLARYISWSMLEDANAKKRKENHSGGAVLVSLNDRVIGVYPSDASP